MQESNKNQGNAGNKNQNQSNQKPIQTPGQQGTDKKFSNDSDVKTGKNLGNQQDRSSKR